MLAPITAFLFDEPFHLRLMRAILAFLFPFVPYPSEHLAIEFHHGIRVEEDHHLWYFSRILAMKFHFRVPGSKTSNFGAEKSPGWDSRSRGKTYSGVKTFRGETFACTGESYCLAVAHRHDTPVLTVPGGGGG